VALRCVSCGKEFDPKAIVYNCDRCGERLDVMYDYDAIKKKITRREIESRHCILPLKYRELLPIFDEEKIASLGEGSTPLVQCRRLGKELGIRNLYVKDETRNPTGVFKDRATVLATNKALEHDRKVVAIASTGNAAASMAGYAAKAGLQCNIFVPEVTPIGKVSQSIAYGARIVQVRGNYDVAFDLTVEACQALGWYNCNPAINPFRMEGKKTIAYELCEQFNWEPPDWIIVPIGNGCDLAGNWKGVKEFYELGFISRKPRMVGIQPEGSNPLVSAYKEKRDALQPMTPKTIAGALAVGKPRNFVKAMRSLKESNGIAESVTDEEILRAQSLLARTEGIFAEPGGAAPLAGMIRLLQNGVISTRDRICVVATGHGLKDPEAPLRLAGKPIVIEPTVDALKSVVSAR
jgi:threonine synthase